LRPWGVAAYPAILENRGGKSHFCDYFIIRARYIYLSYYKGIYHCRRRIKDRSSQSVDFDSSKFQIVTKQSFLNRNMQDFFVHKAIFQHPKTTGNNFIFRKRFNLSKSGIKVFDHIFSDKLTLKFLGDHSLTPCIIANKRA
jgi:hypothetical protein